MQQLHVIAGSCTTCGHLAFPSFFHSLDPTMKFSSPHFLFLFLSFAVTAMAQESFEVTPSRGMIGLSFGNTPQSSLADLPGTIDSKWGGINAVIPVVTSVDAAGTERSFTQLAITGSYRKNTMDLPLTDARRTLSTASLGASWVMIGGTHHFFSISGGVSVAEDRLLTDAPEARVRLSALGSYRLSEPMVLLYGTNYSALFGRDMLLPILGVHWKMIGDWSGTVVLPFTATVRFAAGRDVMLKAAVGATGDRTRIANNGDFTGETPALELRTRGVKASMAFQGRLSTDFRMNVEVGALARRNLEISSGDRTLASSQIASTGFISLQLRFYFSPTGETDDIF